MNRFICDQCQGLIGISQQMRVEERACHQIRYLAPRLFEKFQASHNMCPKLQQWNIFRGIPGTCMYWNSYLYKVMLMILLFH
jgi:hypothetical protein